VTTFSILSRFPFTILNVCRFLLQGGGLVDSILGNGVLSVPEAALGTPAVAAMTIPLHPVAVAGYISLIVNALAVLPIGTTDGGRMGLALFGRGAKLVVGNVALAALFFVGLGGADLFLFYFAFCIACQAGNEIPARNEYDKVGFSRVGVATFTYVLALLSLIPFQ
jgi:membrane-associated protease RseP (regulator of RpoE activity)